MFVSRKAASVRAVDELAGGIRRVTLPLPTRPGHVHAYLLPGRRRLDRSSTPASALPDAKDTWRAELERAGGRVAAVFVTHFHPGPRRGGRRPPRADRRAGVPGRARLRAVRARLGEPDLVRAAPRVVPAARRARRRDRGARRTELALPAVHPLPARPDPRRGGRALDGWELVAAPGHADGQLCLLKDGVLVAADHLLAEDHADRRPLAGEPRRPARRLPRGARADERARRRALRFPATATRSRIRPARARELQEHHRLRLEEAVAALGDEPRTGYELSFALFGDDLKPAEPPLRGRRDAVPRRAARERGSGARGTRTTAPLPILRPDRWWTTTRLVPAPPRGRDRPVEQNLPARCRPGRV